jgi:hypothetical protein
MFTVYIAKCNFSHFLNGIYSSYPLNATFTIINTCLDMERFHHNLKSSSTDPDPRGSVSLTNKSGFGSGSGSCYYRQ